MCHTLTPAGHTVFDLHCCELSCYMDLIKLAFQKKKKRDVVSADSTHVCSYIYRSSRGTLVG